MKTRPLLLTFLVLLAFFTTDCSKNNSNPSGPQGSGGSASLTTGLSVDAGSMSIGPGGGTFQISKPGTPIDGMKINVPPGSFPDMHTYQVSYAPITASQIGPYFNPISPLITISNGGGFSDSLITVRIPAKIPGGQFAMAFFYDPSTGEMEGLPTAAHDSTSLTIITRHFQSSTNQGSLTIARLLKGQDQSSSSIVVSSVDPATLVTGFDSGFRPGRDDWEFANLGSVLCPGGHCAGQSSAALWYYIQKRRSGAAPLWGLLDNDGNQPPTPRIWEDDVLGYKFCSVLQNDHVWVTFSNIATALFQVATVVDSWTFNMFSYALLVTHKPALVIIFGSYGGHAMICYSAGVSTLNIADPNYPGDGSRSITFNLTEFDPYYSGPNARDLGHPFPHIEYGGNSALIDFKQIASRWPEVSNKTIGANNFPPFTLEVLDDSNKFVPLTDGYTQHKQAMSISIRTSGIGISYSVYNEHQDAISSSSTFPPGNHRIGVGVFDDNQYWIGFQWHNITIQADSSIFPLTVGNYWNYRDYSYNVDGSPNDSSDVVDEVKKDTTINGEQWFQLKETHGSSSIVSWMTRRSDGIYLLSPLGGTNPPILLLKFPAMAGDSFASGANGSLTVQVVSTGFSKDFRAGTFDLCYEYMHGPVSGGRPRTSHSFYAIGVGLIETADYEPDGNGRQYLVADHQLVSYSLK